MKIYIKSLGLMGVFLLVCSTAFADGGKRVVEVPQSKPVDTFLRAVKANDLALFKTVYTKAMRQKFKREGWQKALDTYRRLIGKALGDYDVKKLRYGFKGSANAGTVSIQYPKKKLPGLKVQKEGGDWKVSER